MLYNSNTFYIVEIKPSFGIKKLTNDYCHYRNATHLKNLYQTFLGNNPTESSSALHYDIIIVIIMKTDRFHNLPHSLLATILSMVSLGGIIY